MHIIHAKDAPTFALPGIEFTGFASPSRGDSEINTWQIRVEAGHRSGESHTLDQDEIFFVTSGAIRLSPGGAELHPGDAAVVPAGEPIQLDNIGDGPATAYVVVKAGFQAAMADGTAIGTPPWAR